MTDRMRESSSTTSTCSSLRALLPTRPNESSIPVRSEAGPEMQAVTQERAEPGTRGERPDPRVGTGAQPAEIDLDPPTGARSPDRRLHEVDQHARRWRIEVTDHRDDDVVVATGLHREPAARWTWAQAAGIGSVRCPCPHNVVAARCDPVTVVRGSRDHPVCHRTATSTCEASLLDEHASDGEHVVERADARHHECLHLAWATISEPTPAVHAPPRAPAGPGCGWGNPGPDGGLAAVGAAGARNSGGHHGDRTVAGRPPRCLVAPSLVARGGGAVALARRARRPGRRRPWRPTSATSRVASSPSTRPPRTAYTLYSPLELERTYLIDMQGRTVHTWKTDTRPGLSQYLLPNGHLLRAGNLELQQRFGDGHGAGGRIEELDWYGSCSGVSTTRAISTSSITTSSRCRTATCCSSPGSGSPPRRRSPPGGPRSCCPTASSGPTRCCSTDRRPARSSGSGTCGITSCRTTTRPRPTTAM